MRSVSCQSNFRDKKEVQDKLYAHPELLEKPMSVNYLVTTILSVLTPKPSVTFM